MKSLNRFFLTPSIRRRISSAFLIVTVLVVATAIVSYLQLRQVKPTTELIIHNSSDMEILQKLSIATVALDNDLEQYLVIGGLENRETVQTDLQNIADALTLLQGSPTGDVGAGIQADLVKLEELVTRLQDGIQQILDTQAGTSTAETNRKIVLVYQDIEELTQLQETLSAKVVAEIQTTSQAQSRIADNVLTQSIVLGAIVIVVAVITSLLTDRRLRTIGSLTNTAVAISGGDLSRAAPVESNDEIGTLAQAFNTMTLQLRDLIGSLEQRVADRTKDLATVARISTNIATIQDSFQMLATAVHLTQRGFNLYHAHVFTYHKDEDKLQIIACGYKEGDEHEGTHGTASIPLQQEQSLVARAGRTRMPVIVNDVRSDPGWLPNPLLPDTRAELAVPMVVGDELLGVLDVQAEHVDAFTEESADIQMTLASQIATALLNTRSYTEVQKRADREALISDIIQQIQSTTTVDAALQTAAREVGRALGAPTGVQLKSDNGNENR